MQNSLLLLLQICAGLGWRVHLATLRRGLPVKHQLPSKVGAEIRMSSEFQTLQASDRTSRLAVLRSAVTGVISVLPCTWANNAIAAEPGADAVLVAKRAFKAFDEKELPLAEELFSQTIDEWRRLNRGAEEITTLLVARAGVRTDRTEFAAAKSDLDEAIKLMAATGEKSNGIAAYREYPDAFVQRGLAQEGLRDWSGALADYDKAVSLWGGKGAGINPFTLVYRGRTRSELGDYEGAIADFREAASRFLVDKNDDQAAAARAGEAITLYRLGRRDDAVRIASIVTARTPGFTDLHVLLAADAWDRGEKLQAFSEWDMACNSISKKAFSVGCGKYRDVDGWLQDVRRWPSVLIEKQRAFLQRQIPATLPVGT